ncbi:TNF receptor associated factor 2 [Chelydra serpentina]|uniref:TNF receptor-associated factor n=1 Tax=Chelydra serpentina TaxID=8475 RepID=A0A8T1RXC3_CHESE|nr:TNF receptor associated factor 2 [Chelydra serpentina]
MSSLVFSGPHWGSTKPILAPSPDQQGEPEGSPGGPPGAAEKGSRCSWCQVQVGQEGHRLDCGHHCCKLCKPSSSRAGGLNCLQCLEEHTKELLSDLDEDSLLEAVQGAQEARGQLEERLGEVEAQQKTLQNIVTVLSREMGRREGAKGSADRGSASVLGEAMARILHLEEKVAKQDTLLALKDVMISNLGARVEALEQTSYDGHLIWRVPDVRRKMQQARSGQIPSIYSPPFYTSRYGYKLCLKLYLNGDGTGAGTHISLFLVLMQGEYDFQLKWPFLHKITLTLLDQGGERHSSVSFYPPEASSSFQRPVRKSNIASGVPEFFPLGQLHAPGSTYVHEDTLAIEAVIDASPW